MFPKNADIESWSAASIVLSCNLSRNISSSQTAKLRGKYVLENIQGLEIILNKNNSRG